VDERGDGSASGLTGEPAIAQRKIAGSFFQGRCARPETPDAAPASRSRQEFSERKGHAMIEGLFQPMHLLVIFAIALLVFGPKKLPELGKGIGEGIRGFKSAMKSQEDAADKNAAAKDPGQTNF
jgi:sec-independent protein translocase protein TatA